MRIRGLVLDKETLARRNRSMAEAFHAPPIKHRIRRTLLRTLSTIPLPAVHASAKERFLLIRPDHLGDVLLTTPAIRTLRAAYANAEIHTLVGPWSADVVAAYPEVDTVLTLQFPGFSRTPNPSIGSPYRLAAATASQLRRVGYTAAVILRPDHWWGALVAHLANIPVRIGYDLPDTACFLTHAIPFYPEHAVIQNIRLIEVLTPQVRNETISLDFPIGKMDQAFIDGYLEEWNVHPTQAIFCIHPGSGTWVKQWTEEQWAQTADILSEQLNARAVLTGSAGEIPLIRRIGARMQQPVIMMAGDTRVNQLAALFKRAQVVLGPDSGPLHLAAAVKTPTVALFGPADPLEFAQWGPPARHIILTSEIGCRPCRVLDWEGDDPQNHPCIRNITLTRVLDAARRAAQSR